MGGRGKVKIIRKWRAVNSSPFFVNIFYAQPAQQKIAAVQVAVQSNSLYYNMLYVNAQLHSKKRVKHYFGENSIYHYKTDCKNHYIRNESLEI